MDTGTHEVYTYSHTIALHAALPIFSCRAAVSDSEGRVELMERYRPPSNELGSQVEEPCSECLVVPYPSPRFHVSGVIGETVRDGIPCDQGGVLETEDCLHRVAVDTGSRDGAGKSDT